MKWKQIINEMDNKSTHLRLNEPSSELEVSQISAEFKIELPLELVEFYKETNGICEMINKEEIGDFIWKTERLVEENKACRTNPDFKNLYMPFDCLLFIGDVGNGDNFGYSIQNNRIIKTDIFIWNHENDSRVWVAPNLETLVKWWMNGDIEI